MTRRLLALLLVVVLLATSVLAASDLQTSVQHYQNSVPQPGYGAEWGVIAICAAGSDAKYGERYWSAIQQTVADYGGVLDSRKYTEYSRVVLAVTAAGHDATDVGGYDLTAALNDAEAVARQGVNGVLYALLALDSGSYSSTQRNGYVDAILAAQLDDGGWALSGTNGDTDVTAIALQALAPYRSSADVTAAVDAGLTRLSKLQKANGGFASYGAENCESNAQVILALCQLDIALDDPRFVKNGNTALDAMQTYRLSNGSYCHLAEGEASGIATEQAMLAMVSLQRIADGLPGVYTLTEGYRSFTDTTTHWAGEDIDKAVQLGLFTAGGKFRPNENMTRGELVAALWKSAGSPSATAEPFSDVPASASYYRATLWGRSTGIMGGVSETSFAPAQTLTRAQLATALWRMAGKPAAANITTYSGAKQFADRNDTPSWAQTAMGWAVKTGLMNGVNNELQPNGLLTRAQAATMLVRYLEMIDQ